MASGFRSEVKRTFSSELPRRIPAFALSTAALQGHQGVLFDAQVDDRLWLFIYITFAKDRDAFTIELAWNESRCYPFSQMPFTLVNEAGNFDLRSLRERVFRSRIGNLMGERQGIWWSFEKLPSLAKRMIELEHPVESGLSTMRHNRKIRGDKSARIDSIVHDSIEGITGYILPCFQKVAEVRGLKLDWRH